MLNLFNHYISGYNHPAIHKALDDPAIRTYLVARPALGKVPPMHYPERIKSTLMSVSWPYREGKKSMIIFQFHFYFL